jgi:hypothetical protein
MDKLMATGLIFLILSAFVSPAVAADATQGMPKEYKILTVKSDEKAAKLLESFEGKQNVRVCTAESEEDLIKIAATVSEDLGINEKELLKSIEKASDKSSEAYSPEESMTKSMCMADIYIIVFDDGTVIIIIIEY